MHQGQRLKWLIDNSGKSREEVAAAAGIGVASLYNYFREEIINSKKLKLLAEALGIGPAEFNAENILSKEGPDYRKLNEQIRSMEDQLRAKETIIIQQSEMIEMLKAQIQRLKNRKK